MLTEIDKALADAEKQNNDPKQRQIPEEKTKNIVAMTLLRAEVLSDRKDVNGADKLLQEATETYPQQVELWALRALLTAACRRAGGNARREKRFSIRRKARSAPSRNASWL